VQWIFTDITASTDKLSELFRQEGRQALFDIPV
jgi:hypothetical protein